MFKSRPCCLCVGRGLVHPPDTRLTGGGRFSRICVRKSSKMLAAAAEGDRRMGSLNAARAGRVALVHKR